DGVERGAASAGLGMTDEHPVLLAHRARPDVAFGGVVVDRNPAVIQEGMHGTPLAEGVVERFAQPAFRADGGSAEAFERFSQQPDERPAAVMPHPRPDFGARSVVVEVALSTKQREALLDEVSAQCPAGRKFSRMLLTVGRFARYSACLSQTDV